MGFYYLQSRYYDPRVGRFVNADSYVSTAQGFFGYNMFAYCINNPVNFKDVSGSVVVTATVVAVSAVAEVLFELCLSILVVAAIIEIAHEPQQYAPLKKENPAENKIEIKSISTPASPQPPNNNNDNDNNSRKGSIKKLTGQQLEELGLDAHEIKRDYLGRKASIKLYDLFYDTRTGTVYIGNKSGSVMIDTYYNVFYGACF